MNEVVLKGQIRDVKHSHIINGMSYDEANIITKRDNGTEDILTLKFKSFANPYSDGDTIELVGNLRSYSQKVSETKNKVSLYVFTYFDKPDTDEEYKDVTNKVTLDARICKIDSLRYTESGKPNLHLVLANNIFNDNQKLNNYIPAVMWGKLATLNKDLSVSDKVIVKGELHSRTYKKKLDNDELELRTAHELVISSLELINE